MFLSRLCILPLTASSLAAAASTASGASLAVFSSLAAWARSRHWVSYRAIITQYTPRASLSRSSRITSPSIRSSTFRQ